MLNFRKALFILCRNDMYKSLPYALPNALAMRLPSHELGCDRQSVSLSSQPRPFHEQLGCSFAGHQPKHHHYDDRPQSSNPSTFFRGPLGTSKPVSSSLSLLTRIPPSIPLLLPWALFSPSSSSLPHPTAAPLSPLPPSTHNKGKSQTHQDSYAAQQAGPHLQNGGGCWAACTAAAGPCYRRRWTRRSPASRASPSARTGSAGTRRSGVCLTWCVLRGVWFGVLWVRLVGAVAVGVEEGRGRTAGRYGWVCARSGERWWKER